MASFSATSADDFFAKFLPLLGFPEADKIILSKDLFVVPNKDAFQKIVHFLLTKLDAAKADSEFRDCWPIFDKKMEADFRRNCYNWYKDIQIKNPLELPAITGSLFQSPGGRKFLSFITRLIRFVAKEHLKESRLWQPENLTCESAKSSIKGLIISNGESIRNTFTTFHDQADKCTDLSGVLSSKFRTLKTALIQAAATTSELLDEIQDLDKFRQDCSTLRQECIQLELELIQEMSAISSSLATIESIAGGQAKTLSLDIDSVKIFDPDQHLSGVFDKLLASLQDLRLHDPIQFPCGNVESILANVEKQRLKLSAMQGLIESQLLANLRGQNSQAKSQLESIDWEEILGKSQGESVVIPPTPGMKITSSSLTSRPKFLLQNTHNVEESPTKSGGIVKQSTPTIGNQLHTDETSSLEQSRILVRTSLFEQSRILARTSLLDESRILATTSSPEQSRILATTSSLDQSRSVSFKSGFSSIGMPSSATTTSKFILSPRLFEDSPNSSPFHPFSPSSPLTRVEGLTKMTINTPGGKKLKKRLDDLISTLGTTSFLSNNSNDSLLLSTTTQPDFIDF